MTFIFRYGILPFFFFIHQLYNCTLYIFVCERVAIRFFKHFVYGIQAHHVISTRHTRLSDHLTIASMFIARRRMRRTQNSRSHDYFECQIIHFLNWWANAELCDAPKSTKTKLLSYRHGTCCLRLHLTACVWWFCFCFHRFVLIISAHFQNSYYLLFHIHRWITISLFFSNVSHTHSLSLSLAHFRFHKQNCVHATNNFIDKIALNVI